MNYKAHYDKLIFNSKTRLCDVSTYYEKHHIIPKCLGGDNGEENLVFLTAREHYIAHALLAKIYSGTRYGYKLASAFNFMCLDSHNGNRVGNSYRYELARILFSKNHPMKSPAIKSKISESLKEYYKSEQYQIDKLKKSSRKIGIPRISVLCGCGCGETFIKLENSDQKFIKNHFQQILNRDRTVNGRRIKTFKATLDSMSKEDMEARIKNSLGKADPIQRGNAISKGKRGKKTNQNLIEILKYGAMSDHEFEEFIKTKSYRVHNRIRNKRKLYHDNRSYYDDNYKRLREEL